MKIRALLLLSLIFFSSVAHTQTAQHAHDAQSLSEFRSNSMTGDMSLDFALLNGDGQKVQRSDFLGKNVLVTFGFTHCPDVCPTVVLNMANAIKHTDKEAVGVFISIDTERDTPEITDSYARYFNNNMIGLSGSHEAVSDAAKNFNVTFVVTKSPDNYSVQHSPGTFLISPEGQLIEMFAMNADYKVIAAAMQ